MVTRGLEVFAIQVQLLRAEQLARAATISVASRNDDGALRSIVAAIEALDSAYWELRRLQDAYLPS